MQRLSLFVSTILLVALCLPHTCLAIKDAVELQATNFELVLTNYRYAAILFYDKSTKHLLDEWLHAASMPILEGLKDSECTMAYMDAEDPEVEEVKLTYALKTPGIKVFRRGALSNWRGPLKAEAIAEYIAADAKHPLVTISSIEEVKKAVSSSKKATILAFFMDERLDAEGQVDVPFYDELTAVADSLREHVNFIVIKDPELMEDLDVSPSSTPAIILMNARENAPPVLVYSDAMKEGALADWIIKQIQPVVGELAFSTPAAEAFSSSFFSSRRLKFILIVKPSDLIEGNQQYNSIEVWKEIAEANDKKAIFSYMIDEIIDVMEYFNVAASDLPIIIGHNAKNDFKYISEANLALRPLQIQTFITGVISGKISRVFKSEPIPTKQMQEDSRGVVIATGNTVDSIVSMPGKDIFLMVHAPSCVQCKKMRPTLEVLARAVQAEPRIVIAKVDGSANDLPVHWDVKGYPALLYFKSSEKTVDSPAVPQHYVEQGYGLHELFTYIIAESSFDTNSLHVATPEQIGTLLSDEEILRAKYEVQERFLQRNEGREVLENKILDYFYGEVVFDGKRWHIVLAISLGFLLLLLMVASASGSKTKSSEKVKTEKTVHVE